ncbi:LptA/OstA family protein [Brevundimonas sp.]|uniref:LptA/OstA family protein n=1 Tax=Brevundimonas sp. TaxID=1871086 RepID=UPI003783BC93
MRKTTSILFAATVALAGLAVPMTGDAQNAAPSVSASGQPVAFGADGGEYTPTGFSLRGRAEITQAGNRLRADAITATTANNDLSRVEASGNVYFVTPTQSMRGDRAVYTLGNGEVVVTGDVILTQGKNVLTGSRLVYNVRTETARMESGTGGRIQGVFYPQGN